MLELFSRQRCLSTSNQKAPRRHWIYFPRGRELSQLSQLHYNFMWLHTSLRSNYSCSCCIKPSRYKKIWCTQACCVTVLSSLYNRLYSNSSSSEIYSCRKNTSSSKPSRKDMTPVHALERARCMPLPDHDDQHTDTSDQRRWEERRWKRRQVPEDVEMEKWKKVKERSEWIGTNEKHAR